MSRAGGPRVQPRPPPSQPEVQGFVADFMDTDEANVMMGGVPNLEAYERESPGEVTLGTDRPINDKKTWKNTLLSNVQAMHRPLMTQSCLITESSLPLSCLVSDVLMLPHLLMRRQKVTRSLALPHDTETTGTRWIATCSGSHTSSSSTISLVVGSGSLSTATFGVASWPHGDIATV